MPELEGESTTESTSATPRRRRAASRPAGPPVDAPVTAEVPQTTAAGTAETAPVAEEPKKPATRRRRATRVAAAPDDPKVATEVEAPKPETEAEAPKKKPARRRKATPKEETSAATSEDPTGNNGEDAAAKKPTRRRSTRSKKSEDTPEPSAEEPKEVQARDAEPQEQPAETGQPEKKPARRRRSNRSQESQAETSQDSADSKDDEDGIGAALRLAEEQAASRKAQVADPFAVTRAGRQAALDELAGAIANEEEEQSTDAEDKPEGKSKQKDNGEKQPKQRQDDEQKQEQKSDESDDDSDDSDESNDSDDSESRPSRRRRRRGGRRRRRSNRDDADNDSDDDDSDDSSDDDDSDSDDSSDNEGGGRRRRRRRRRGGSNSENDKSADDEITGIEGSTRMEAKRQRRKENRAAGRRRAPILSEAEFLARRESVNRKMVIRQSDDYTQLAVVEDDILVEHYVDRATSNSLIGNVYLGKVQNVLPSMEAAFIDIGRGRNAVLYAGEVDWDHFGVTAEDRKVEKVFKSGQSVLVQVTKDPVGAKGARLTGHISLPGRYIVYSPGGHLSGISRKLPDSERSRLRETLGELISDDESVIVRTAAEGVSSEELVRDVNRLKAQWEVIEKKVKQGKAPQALHAEPDLTLRIVRDLFTEDFSKLVVQGNGGQEDAWETISAYVGHVAPHLAERLEKFEPADDGKDVFAKYRVDEQIAKALDRKVYLPSGGSLVIDRTEAMTVIDVNTGRFTGTGGNLEATVTSNNLEAAEEIVRQLRLRDLGGIIVIDFIDMVLPSNRELLLRRLVECLGRDRTRHQVAEVTSLGLVQLTRKRIGTGLGEAFTEECECCNGAGYVRYDEPVDSQAPADGGDRKSGGGRRGRGKKND